MSYFSKVAPKQPIGYDCSQPYEYGKQHQTVAAIDTKFQICIQIHPCCETVKPCAVVAEFLAAMLFVTIVTSAAMGDNLFGYSHPVGYLPFAAGLAHFGIFCAFFSWSGSHINPIVTFGYLLVKWFCPNSKQTICLKAAFFYWLAQLLGSFVGVLIPCIFAQEGSTLGTPVPQLDYSSGYVFLSEMFGVFFLMLVVFFSMKNSDCPHYSISAMITAIFLVLAFISGPSLNPFRYLAPALISWTWVAWWAYIFAPFVGCFLAVLVFWLCCQCEEKCNDWNKPHVKEECV